MYCDCAPCPPFHSMKNEGNKLILDDNFVYVKVTKEFGEELEKQMKLGNVWESIFMFDDEYYMPEKKYEVYKALSKVLKR